MADATSTDTTSTPPWGDDFDAAKAWTLIQNLRTEKATLQSDRDEWKGKAQAAESSTGDQDGKIRAAEERATTAEKALWVERALRKHKDADLDDYVDFLEGATEEEVLAKADRLASIGGKKEADDKKAADEAEGDKPKADDKGDKDAEDDGLPGRPSPSLKPGHGGDAPAPFDPAAIAKQARERGAY